nr:MAG TPA: hypothetical protein [Caudoviricetes sp.]
MRGILNPYQLRRRIKAHTCIGFSWVKTLCVAALCYWIEFTSVNCTVSTYSKLII